MKHFTFFFALVLFSSFLFAQEELIPDKQFMLGCKNVGSSEQVTHYINAAGEVWQYSSGSFITGGVYSSSLITVGNANFSSSDWPGFNFNWFLAEPHWSLGLYKVTNSKQTDKYFYLDSRESDFGAAVYNPDFYIYFDNDEDAYFHRGGGEISQGEVVRVWDVHEESPNTNGIQNYWSNVLVILTDGRNPRIVWGPHPTFQATYYKVYRAASATPLGHPEFFASVIATVSSSTYEYTDNDITLYTNGAYLYYFVKGYNGSYSGRSNIEFVRGYFYKENTSGEDDQELRFNLNQNYPNPFNPSTIISYSVERNSLVSLKVYDIIGIEIASLVNETKESGNYAVSFDASKLSSGIYFYTLNANGYSETKKMLLVR